MDVFTGLSGFKGMLDAAKALKGINDAVVRNEAVIDLQGQILAAQENYGALQEKVRDLEEKVASFERWDEEKNRYEMKALASGSIAYALKPEEQGIDPPHYICAACYQRRKASILQRVPGNAAASYLQKPRMLRCPQCSSEIIG